MPSPQIIDGPTGLANLAGTELGVSDWHLIDQSLIDSFASVSRDHQWIHVDVPRASHGPFGATLAHGLLVLSLLPALAAEVYQVEGTGSRLNYGYDAIRFVSPVKCGARIRDRVTLRSVENSGPNVKAITHHVVEIEDSERPACVADSITIIMPV
ncbi:MaoC family dehydratase [soil metagenome]